MEVTIRDLPPERWPEAGAMAGRAFWTEDYMRPLGEQPLARYATIQDVYLGMDIGTEGSVTLGAFAGNHIVGVACITGAGACFFCGMDPAAGPEDDGAISAYFHEIDLAIRLLHADLPPTPTSDRSRSNRRCRTMGSAASSSRPRSRGRQPTAHRR